MGNKRPREAEHARVSGERTIGELGQLPVETARQIVSKLANLVFDDVKVVHQPFRRRCDRSLFTDRTRDGAVGGEKDATVAPQPPRQSAAPAALDRVSLCFSETLGVLFEALEAEELGANRLFQLVPRNGGTKQAESKSPGEGGSLQFSDPNSLDRIVSLAIREALRPFPA
jgi:hypothetical protein